MKAFSITIITESQHSPVDMSEPVLPISPFLFPIYDTYTYIQCLTAFERRTIVLGPTIYHHHRRQQWFTTSNTWIMLIIIYLYNELGILYIFNIIYVLPARQQARRLSICHKCYDHKDAPKYNIHLSPIKRVFVRG